MSSLDNLSFIIDNSFMLKEFHQNFKKHRKFYCTGLLRSSKLVHLDSKNSRLDALPKT